METNTPGMRAFAIRIYTQRPAYIKVSDVAKAINKTPEWLRRFALGSINDPGVVTIEKLIAYVGERTKKGE